MLLLSYDASARRIAFRHYAISAQPSGVSKGVKSLVARRQLPDMGAMADVAEFLTKGGYGSVRIPLSGPGAKPTGAWCMKLQYGLIMSHMPPDMRAHVSDADCSGPI